MRVVLIGIVCTILPLWLRASIPVIDFASIENLMHNYSMLKQQYETMREQVNVVTQLKQTAMGHYGMGNLLNDVQSFEDRQWSPEHWQDALRGLSGGNKARYQQLLDLYQHNNHLLTEQQFEHATNSTDAKRYQHNIEVNRAVSVNSSYAFDNIKHHLDSIHAISEQIDKTDNTKAAVDLNSRLIAELAYIHTQELKMQILLNQQMASSVSNSLNQQSAAAAFNTLNGE